MRRRRRRRLGGSDDAAKHGPIKIWFSNNPEEVAWGKAMVAAWNADHPNEKVTAQEIPAGKTSEEVIGAAITAGNAPCLVFNTSPAAVPAVPEAGRPGRRSTTSRTATQYIEARTGDDGRAVPVAGRQATTRCRGSPTR